MKYLREADHETAMKVWASGETPEPLTNTIWTFDFMALSKHNIPCPVCFNSPACLSRNVTPGAYCQSIEPCTDCTSRGWRIDRTLWSRVKSYFVREDEAHTD